MNLKDAARGKAGMKANTVIKDFFSFTRGELRGIVILLSIYGCLVLATILLPSLISEKRMNFSAFEKEIAAFEKDLRRLDSLEEQDKQKRFAKSAGGWYPRQDTMAAEKGKPRELILVELNSADTFELQKLHGIGSSFARRIIKYRERLGGFYDKSQVREVWGMDTSRYNKIAMNLTLNRDSIHKMDLNTVSFKVLLFHPYFPYEISRSIILYRKEHKRFTRIEELRTLPGIYDSIYRKMAPYLKIEN
jgi:competence ComEA-like helix-hairpin-helix protein